MYTKQIYLTTTSFPLPTWYIIFVAAMADTNAPKYNPNPINKLPSKPITIDDIAVNTVPITDAITFTPHSKVIFPSPLRRADEFIEEEDEGEG